MGRFSVYEYRKQPGFDMNTFEGANQAIPMKTLVIYCVDPRASGAGRARGDSGRLDRGVEQAQVLGAVFETTKHS